MKTSLLLFALAAVTVAPITPATAQLTATLNLDDLIGVWNVTNENGQQETFTISRGNDGAPKIIVSSSTGQEGNARDVEIEGDTVTFSRDLSQSGISATISYTAKLADGNLDGTTLFALIPAQGQTVRGSEPIPIPFSASKVE